MGKWTALYIKYPWFLLNSCSANHDGKKIQGNTRQHIFPPRFSWIYQTLSSVARSCGAWHADLPPLTTANNVNSWADGANQLYSNKSRLWLARDTCLHTRIPATILLFAKLDNYILFRQTVSFVWRHNQFYRPILKTISRHCEIQYFL